MTVEKGDTVKVHYVGRHTDGTVFDTSREDVAQESGVHDERRDYEPIEFEVGAGEMIQGFDEAVVGMSEGETKEVEVPPEKAYGVHDDEKVHDYDRDELTEAIGQEPEEGMHLHLEGGAHGDITGVEENTVEVDFNHHLAGETLVFEVEVVEA